MNAVLERASEQVDRLPTTVLVSHSCPLISAGLVSTLRRMSNCDVRVCDDSRGPWLSPNTLDGVDVVVADVELLARKPTREGGTQRDGETPSPKLVLITSHKTAMNLSAPMWGDVGACLSIRCAEQEVVDAVRGVVSDAASNPHAAGCDADAATRINHLKPSRSTHSQPRGGLAPGALRRVREHVESRLSEKIELRELASIAGLSECHFSRAFRQSMGMPPHRYLMSRRIASASLFIETTDRSMTEIALDVGFSDQSHFTRVFVAMTGETPRAFRKRHR